MIMQLFIFSFNNIEMILHKKRKIRLSSACHHSPWSSSLDNSI